MKVELPESVVGLFHADALVRDCIGEIHDALADAKRAGGRNGLYAEVPWVLGDRPLITIFQVVQ